MRGGDAASFLGCFRSGLLLLSLIGLCSCAPRRPAETGRAPGELPLLPYSAKIQLTAEARSRGMSLPAGVAVDPAGFARVELREPLGATILVLAISPRAGRLLSPDLRQEALWDKASEALPWSPSELWCLLSGEVPAGADSLSDWRGGSRRASWKGPFGKVIFRTEPSPGRTFPPAVASLRGPGKARLTVAWRTVYDAPPPREALLPPPPAAEQVPLDSLLKEIFQ